MFQGTLPADALSVISPVVKGWGCEDLAFPCSGKFTVPRSLMDLGVRMHGNDVTLYSCALGSYFSGGDVEVRPRHGLGLEWLEPYLGTALDRVAAVLVFSEYAEAWIKRGTVPFYRRLAGAARAQFEEMHRKVGDKLTNNNFELASFFAGDCVEFVKSLPESTGIITFPPIYKSGYERMFKNLHACLDWPAPTYQVFDDARLNTYLEMITARPFWIYGAQSPIDHERLEGRFLSKVQTTNRGTKFFLYASSGDPSRLVTPHQKLEPLLFPKLGQGEPVGEVLSMVPLTTGQFATLRSQYLDPSIAPAGAMLRLALLADGKLIGAVAFDRCKFQLSGVEPPSIYLLSDFSIGAAPRLSKLVAASALSRECQLLLEQAFSRRIRSVVTTAFSDHAVSMKYRGVFKLLCRKDAEAGDHHPFKLSYGGDIGKLTLAATLAAWRKKNA